MPSPKSILVLGAGELGSQVLTSLTTHPRRGNFQIALLLRPSTMASSDPSKQAELETYRKASISLILGDVAADTIAAVVLTVSAVAGTALLGHLAVGLLLERSRMRRWTRGWAAVEPLWTAGSP